jgi:hypothetical protein
LGECWPVPVILALRRQRQEGCEFEVSLNNLSQKKWGKGEEEQSYFILSIRGSIAIKNDVRGLKAWLNW